MDAGGDEPTLLLYNPHGFAVKQSVRLPYLPPMADAPDPKRGFGLEDLVPTGPSSHRIQRQDVVTSDLPEHGAYYTDPVEVPPLSYVTIPAARAAVMANGSLSAKDGVLSNGRLTVMLDPNGGLTSLKLDGTEYAGAASEHLKFGVPVLERVASGVRTDMFDQVDLESPDWHLAWHRDWQAERFSGKLVETTEAVERGNARIVQRFELPNGDKVDVLYRLVGEELVLHVEATVTKQPIVEPHALYLPMPTALTEGWEAHYETGGAVVKLDDEQLPYASRHYITAQRFVRIADATSELAVACPDAPLWQVGDPDGRVARERPTLVAWLTNNYWSTNFQADQGGQSKYRYTLAPSPRREIGASAQAALAYAQPLASHVYADRGPVRSTAGSLLDLKLAGLLLSRLETAGDGVALTLLNPGDDAVEAAIGPGRFKPSSASRTSLSGDKPEGLAVTAGEVRLTVAPRAWTRIELH
jgi:hypothetical protein